MLFILGVVSAEAILAPQAPIPPTICHGLRGLFHINTNGRKSKPAFNIALLPEENLGQLDDAKRQRRLSAPHTAGGEVLFLKFYF
jgi:hypothetical protein